jgi:hypothetical protein
MGSISHSIAILCTIFRLVYRSWTHHFWWEDAWAAFALIADGKYLKYFNVALFSGPTTYPSRLLDMYLD